MRLLSWTFIPIAKPFARFKFHSFFRETRLRSPQRKTGFQRRRLLVLLAVYQFKQRNICFICNTSTFYWVVSATYFTAIVCFFAHLGNNFRFTNKALSRLGALSHLTLVLHSGHFCAYPIVRNLFRFGKHAVFQTGQLNIHVRLGSGPLRPKWGRPVHSSSDLPRRQTSDCWSITRWSVGANQVWFDATSSVISLGVESFRHFGDIFRRKLHLLYGAGQCAFLAVFTGRGLSMG